MLDIQQIKISTQHTLAVLKHIHSIDGVQLVTDFFDQALLDKLLEYCQTTSQWQPVYDLEQKEIDCRKKITWETDTVVEVAHTVLQNITPQLEKTFNKQLKFNGLDLWKDTEGYFIKRHTDNPAFNASIQIYINNLPHLVTVFEHNGIHTTDPNSGSGYIADNTVGVPHWLNGVVPADFSRYSLHATWT